MDVRNAECNENMNDLMSCDKELKVCQQTSCNHLDESTGTNALSDFHSTLICIVFILPPLELDILLLF